jgi:hypothetical protein
MVSSPSSILKPTTSNSSISTCIRLVPIFAGYLLGANVWIIHNPSHLPFNTTINIYMIELNLFFLCLPRFELLLKTCESWFNSWLFILCNVRSIALIGNMSYTLDLDTGIYLLNLPHHWVGVQCLMNWKMTNCEGDNGLCISCWDWRTFLTPTLSRIGLSYSMEWWGILSFCCICCVWLVKLLNLRWYTKNIKLTC